MLGSDDSDPADAVFADPTIASGQEVLSPPRLVEAPSPIYPQRCLSGAQALETVIVRYNVTVGGAVVGERIASASNACFESAALNAMRRWRFEPATADGTPRARL